MLLFDVNAKRYKSIFDAVGIEDILTFCLKEVEIAFNRSSRHLNGKIGALDNEHIAFLNEILRFMYLLGCLA